MLLSGMNSRLKIIPLLLINFLGSAIHKSDKNFIRYAELQFLLKRTKEFFVSRQGILETLLIFQCHLLTIFQRFPN